MTNYITYLLGAGASYHALPVVDGMNHRMKSFLEMFTKSPTAAKFSQNHENYYGSKDYRHLWTKYIDIVENACNHRTVDTYAKKLYLQKEGEKLELLKSFLSLYFAFEQSPDKRKIAYKINGEDSELLETQYLKTIDYRYDVFFATLLNSSFELPSNIRILSWNYDMQLELAHNEFLKAASFGESREKLGISEDQSDKVIKLNGSAHQAISLKNNKPYYLSENRQLDLLKSIIKAQDMRDSSDSLNYRTNLQFAWEESVQKSIALNMSKEILQNTKELIIIGYSFPYFNRSIDQSLIGTNNEIRKVKVQCSPSDFNGIKQSLLDINYDLKDCIEYHNDLSQFYIPNDLLS